MLATDDNIISRERSNTLPGSFVAIEVREAPLTQLERYLLQETVDGYRCVPLLLALSASFLRVTLGLVSFTTRQYVVQHVAYIIWSMTVLLSTALEVRYFVKASDHCPTPAQRHSMTPEN